MKNSIYLLALILGISGTAVAQQCGTGSYGSNGGSSYYNAIETVGKVTVRKRGYVDRLWVTEASIVKDRGNRMSVEYILDNGDVLTVMMRKKNNGGHGNGHGNGHQANNYHNPYAVGASNNYYYGSNSGRRNGRFGTFDVHCVRLNGRVIDNGCGTVRIEKGYGRSDKTFINLDMARLGKWKGNAEIFRRGGGGRY